MGWAQERDLNLRVVGGWCNDGYNFQLRTQHHGKMPKINIEYTINSAQHGHPLIYVDHEFNFGVYTAIIPESVTATAYRVPQVVVFANGQRSACRGDANGMCDYKWSNDHTASVVSVSAASTEIAWGDEVTIVFDIGQYAGTLDNTKFLLSGSELNCDMSTVTDDGSEKTVVCTVVNVPVSDSHTFIMSIPEVGKADYTDKTLSSVSGVATMNQRRDRNMAELLFK